MAVHVLTEVWVLIAAGLVVVVLAPVTSHFYPVPVFVFHVHLPSGLLPDFDQALSQ
jgi:hypothetical protein